MFVLLKIISEATGTKKNHLIERFAQVLRTNRFSTGPVLATRRTEPFKPAIAALDYKTNLRIGDWKRWDKYSKTWRKTCIILVKLNVNHWTDNMAAMFAHK